MYGTVAKCTVKPGEFDDVLTLLEEWRRQHKQRAHGAMGSFAYRLDSDPNVLVMCVAFHDKTSYMANADDPEQDKWFSQLREHLTHDPEWMDGEIVHTL